MVLLLRKIDRISIEIIFINQVINQASIVHHPVSTMQGVPMNLHKICIVKYAAKTSTHRVIPVEPVAVVQNSGRYATPPVGSSR